MLKSPHTVDLNVNWVCNLNCPWCWWPEHAKNIETFTDDEWSDLIKFLAENGTQSFIFTGGEPLLKVSLRRLLRESYSLWVRNTLSTNWILLQTHQDVLDLVHDVGIPLDWSDSQKNQVMRVGTPLHFQRAIEALRWIQKTHPYIDLTVRTVASSKNAYDIAHIWSVLLENWINPTKLRWKIYQCSTSGPRRGKTISDWWLISDEKFKELEEQVRTANPQFTHIKFQPLEKSTWYRYFHIAPNGDLKVVESDSRWFPFENTIGRIGGGNISEQMEEIIQNNPDIFIPLSQNSSHG
jgi:MoaA/NifB/PqqE/SkfB family radical SAM enzyme